MEMCIKNSTFTEEDLHLLCDVVFDYLRCSVSITRGDGVFIRANTRCEKVFGFKASEYVGLPTLTMQKQGIFNPSIALQVLETKQKITTTQADKHGFTRPIEAIPLFDEQGIIRFVICFSAWDITSYEDLQAEYQRLENELMAYTAEVRQLRAKDHSISSVVTENMEMKKINQLVAQVAPYQACVLFSGPSGVGKTFYAKKLHSMGRNCTGPFIEFNCHTTPAHIVEYELFGDSGKQKKIGEEPNHHGAFMLAENGTLLLKEIDHLSLDMQVRLAGLLAEIQDARQAKQPHHAGVGLRVVATTNKNLMELVTSGHFREELYYLVRAIPIKIPALKDRPEDLLAFILFYSETKNREYGLNKTFTQKAIDVMLEYTWPGNIREVLSVIERVFLTTTDEQVDVSGLPSTMRKASEYISESGAFSLKDVLEFYEKKFVLEAYKEHKTTTAVAKALGISQPSATRKLAKYKFS